jgi:hypothetical protein
MRVADALNPPEIADGCEAEPRSGQPRSEGEELARPAGQEKRTNLARTRPRPRRATCPTPYGKNKEAQTMRLTPSNTPPRDMPHDDRIHRELTSGKRSNSHSRSGR